MTSLDWLIVGAFAAYAISSGLRARKAASRGLEDYFLAGRGLSGWSAGISMAATQFAADTPLLVTGLIATAGVFSLWRLWIYALAFLLMGYVLAASWRRSGVLTDAELAELRYGGRSGLWLRGIKAVYFGTVFNCTVLAMVLWAAKEIAEPFFTWHAWLPADLFAAVEHLVTWVGVPFARAGAEPGALWRDSADNLLSLLALVSVTLFYSATGGLRSVVRTDVVQFAVMMVAMAVYAVYAVDAGGGLAAIDRALRESTGPLSRDQVLAFTPGHAHDAGWLVLTVCALQWLVQMNADGTGYLAQRSMACRSDRDAKLAAVVFSFAQVGARSLLWLPIGLGLLVAFPPAADLGGAALQADREATFVRGIAELLPSGVRGMMVTAMLAALASTIDTHLNWGASYWTNDLYDRIYCQAWRGRAASPHRLVVVARLSSLLILVVGLAIMTQLQSIQTAWHISLLLGAGMGVMLVLRWLWWRINGVGELACIAASTLLAPLLLLTLPPHQEALRLLLMALGSTAAGVAASLATRPEPESRLRTFYQRARPPGFWAFPGQSEAAATAARGRLARGVAAMSTTAASLFLLLSGFGSWLIGSPAPDWIASASLWSALQIALGTALIPVWVRIGFKEQKRNHG